MKSRGTLALLTLAILVGTTLGLMAPVYPNVAKYHSMNFLYSFDARQNDKISIYANCNGGLLQENMDPGILIINNKSTSTSSGWNLVSHDTSTQSKL